MIFIKFIFLFFSPYSWCRKHTKFKVNKTLTFRVSNYISDARFNSALELVSSIFDCNIKVIHKLVKLLLFFEFLVLVVLLFVLVILDNIANFLYFQVIFICKENYIIFQNLSFAKLEIDYYQIRIENKVGKKLPQLRTGCVTGVIRILITLFRFINWLTRFLHLYFCLANLEI